MFSASSYIEQGLELNRNAIILPAACASAMAPHRATDSDGGLLIDALPQEPVDGLVVADGGIDLRVVLAT